MASKSKFWEGLFTSVPFLRKLAKFLQELPAYFPWQSWHRSGKVMAIEIGSLELKLMVMTKRRDVYRVEYYVVVPVPPGAIVENEIKKPAALSSLLQRVIERTRQQAHFVITALPASVTITKRILVNDIKDDLVLESLVENLASKYIPHKLEEVSLDYVRLEKSQANPGKMEVLLVAAQTKDVADRVEVIEQAGLIVKILDVENYAICRALKLLKDQIPETVLSNGIIGIFNIGARITSLNVITSNDLIYTHEELFGGEQLTEIIQRRYGLSHQQADLAKQTGELPSDYQLQVLEPFKQAVVQQIVRSLQFFYSSSSYDKVNFIVLAGGVSLTPGLVGILKKALNIEVIVADFSAGLEFSGEVDQELFKSNASTLMTLLGLAMRGADL